MERLVTLIFRMLFSRLLGKGMTHLASRGKPAAPMTAQERAQAKAGRVAAKRARQAIRVGRRLGR